MNIIRSLDAINKQKQELTDMVFYQLHRLAVRTGKIDDRNPGPIDAHCLAMAKKIEDNYPIEKLTPMPPHEYGITLGKLTVLRWMLGEDINDPTHELPKTCSLDTICEWEHELTDVLFYQNHAAATNSSEIIDGYNGIFVGTLNKVEAERIEDKYPIEKLGPMGWTTFALALGKLAALRWLLNKEWGLPDCSPWKANNIGIGDNEN